MAVRVFSCLLLMTVLFVEEASSNGGKDGNSSLPETLNCTGFFCGFVLTPCLQYNVTALRRTGSIDLAFSGNLSNCARELITGQAVVSVANGIHAVSRTTCCSCIYM